MLFLLSAMKTAVQEGRFVCLLLQYIKKWTDLCSTLKRHDIGENEKFCSDIQAAKNE